MPADDDRRPAATRPAPKYPKGVNFQISLDMARQLDSVAVETGQSRADIIRACIEDALAIIAQKNGLAINSKGGKLFYSKPRKRAE